MAGVSFDTLTEKKQELVRKTIDLSFFSAPHTANGLTTLTDTDKLLKALPTGWGDTGLLTTDGIRHSREVNVSDVRSAGRIDPSRSDITSDQTSIQIACQETKLLTIGLYTGQDMSGVTPDPTTGEVSIAKPARPRPRYYRGLSIGMDETDAGEIYIGRYFPRCRVTNYDDQPFQSEEDEALLWPVTLTAYVDSTVGYSERWLFGGPGWFALLSEMGF
jgi:hypothetical protein